MNAFEEHPNASEELDAGRELEVSGGADEKEPAEEKKPSKTSRMVALHNEGKSVGEIAKVMGVKYQHVYNTLKSKGITPGVQKRDGSKSAEIKKLAKEGLTCGQIAKKLGIRYQHAYNVLGGKINRAADQVEEEENEEVRTAA